MVGASFVIILFPAVKLSGVVILYLTEAPRNGKGLFTQLIK